MGNFHNLKMYACSEEQQYTFTFCCLTNLASLLFCPSFVRILPVFVLFCVVCSSLFSSHGAPLKKWFLKIAPRSYCNILKIGWMDFLLHAWSAESLILEEGRVFNILEKKTCICIIRQFLNAQKQKTPLFHTYSLKG
jgi:hypothetical protein